ncbi:MAG TPA: fibronectin type III-like domain-contianing protein, partial [Usitatibacter sp.]|nr:fibronectin type III-like domain-contianing protein [Usitatibacter sp.]
SEFAAALRARARDRVEWVDARAADRVIVIAANDPAALRRTLDEAASAGRPIVVVLASDRPSVDADTSLRANALVAAWNLGPMGAKATAAVLFGDANPSGKLPLTLARSPGELPLFHDAKPSSQLPYLFDDGKPLYAFGFGLSYTAFEVSVPKVAKARVPEGAPVAVSVEVRNTGARRGEETVQVYVRDKVSTVTTPVIRLAGFRKIALGPGEKRTVKFSIAATRLALWDGAMHHVVEPGEFEVLAGSDSAHLRGAAVTVLAKGRR